MFPGFPALSTFGALHTTISVMMQRLPAGTLVVRLQITTGTSADSETRSSIQAIGVRTLVACLGLVAPTASGTNHDAADSTSAEDLATFPPPASGLFRADLPLLRWRSPISALAVPFFGISLEPQASLPLQIGCVDVSPSQLFRLRNIVMTHDRHDYNN